MANFNRGKYTFSAGPYCRAPGRMAAPPLMGNPRHQTSNHRYPRMQSAWQQRPNMYNYPAQMQQSSDYNGQMSDYNSQMQQSSDYNAGQMSDYNSQMQQYSVPEHEVSVLRNENQMLKERLDNLEAMIQVHPNRAPAGNRYQPEMEEVAFRKAVLFEEIRKPHYKPNGPPYSRPNTNHQTNGRDPRHGRFNQQPNRGGNHSTSLRTFDIADDVNEAPPSWTVVRTSHLPTDNIVPESLPWNKKPTEASTSTMPPWQARRAGSLDVETKKLREKKRSKSPVPEVEEVTVEDSNDCELDIEREENVQFCKYNDLGFEEDENGRVIAYIQSRTLPDYYGKMTAGLGIFFSPMHPCNISVGGEMSSNDVNAQLEASIKAIQAVWNYNLTKIAICTDSEYLFGRLLLPKSNNDATGEEKKIRQRLQEAISPMTVVSFVPLTMKRNEVYLREAQYLANMAAGLAPTPPPSLSQLHLCTDEVFDLGDVVTVRSESNTISVNSFKGLYEIAQVTDAPVLYYVESLLRPEIGSAPEILAKDELHLVKKKTIQVKEIETIDLV